MTFSRILARRLMDLATLRPPPHRAAWAMAMRGEFERLERDELSWAFGCLTTAAGWTLRAQAFYLGLLALTPFLIYLADQLPFDLLWYGLVSRASYMEFARHWGAIVGMLEPLPLAFLLGAYRPNSVPTTLVLGCLIGQHVGGTLLTMSMLGGSFLSWWGPGATLYMAPPLVGLFGSLAIWYLGASAGAKWAAGRVSQG
jgi:hypothetical protein